MKKLLMFVFVCIAVTGAYAQFNWDLEMDFNSDMVRMVRPTGDAATQYFIFDGSPDRIANTGADRLPANIFLAERNVDGYRPGSFTSGSTSFFNHQGVQGWTHFNQLRMNLNGTGESVSWRVRINIDELVAPGGRMVTGSGRPAGLQELLFTQIIDQWWVRGTAGMFSVWAGIDEHGRGATDEGRFQDFTDVTRGVNIENFGVMVPNGLIPTVLNEGADNNNFVRAWELTGALGHFHFTVPMLVFTARLGNFLPVPLSLDLAFDPGRNAMPITAGAAGNPRNALAVNGGIRVSGERIIDMFNFDLIYQLRGRDMNTLENVVIGEDGNPLPGFGQNQPDGSGVYVHSMGAYVHFISPLPDLGVSLGYSALFRTFEDDAATWAGGAWHTVSTISPLFHGIDLRLRYTGIPNLRITFNNNVSFATANHGTWDTAGNRVAVAARGLDGAIMTTSEDQVNTQSWFGLYNALAFRYALNSQLSFQLQAASRLGRTIEENNLRTPVDGDVLRIERTSFNFSAAALASYQFNFFVLIEAGLSMRIQNNAFERQIVGNPAPTDLNSRNWNSGSVGFSVPIRMRLTY